jgi:hypothetical protein
MIFFVKYDSIRYLVFKGDYAGARAMIKQVYHRDEKATRVMDYIELSSRKESSTVTLKDCFTVLEYRRSTLIAISIIIFHEMTGENAILLYSTEMFKRMESYQDLDYALSPRQGTILIGFFNLLAHIPAVFLIKKLPRRTLLIYGHIIIAVCHIFVGAFAASTNDLGVVIMMSMFMVVYVITNGPIIWLYVSEIASDAALGFCLFILWTFVLLLSLSTNFLMESFLRPQGVFWIFGAVSLGGAFFNYHFAKETRGLSDKEKKTLYSSNYQVIQKPKDNNLLIFDSTGNSNASTIS